MAFSLSPSDYLQILEDQLAEYTADPLSLRKAISLCLFANHIPEHVFATYGSTAPTKVHGARSVQDYRLHLQQANFNLLLMRDLCDYGKHGPTLNRASVSVATADVEQTMVLDSASFLAGVPNHFAEDKLVVKLKDGSERFFDALAAAVMQFWKSEFAAYRL